jgi:fumarylacetoacetase
MAVDFELEVGAVLGGPSNPLGEAVELARAEDRIFGFCLLNDWSARDIQSWEMVPLGPFNGKNWATTVSAWIVTAEAMEPWVSFFMYLFWNFFSVFFCSFFLWGKKTHSLSLSLSLSLSFSLFLDFLFQIPFKKRTSSVPQEDPRPLPYLDEETANLRSRSALDVSLEVEVKTTSSSSSSSASSSSSSSPPCPGCVVSRSNARHLYWSFPQMVTHHSAGGCPLLPGDLLGSGTVSAPGGIDGGGLGCLLEMTRAGREPLRLACGTTRTYLEDGDEVVLRGRCEARGGVGRIGWGEARGRLLPALALK